MKKTPSKRWWWNADSLPLSLSFSLSSKHQQINWCNSKWNTSNDSKSLRLAQATTMHQFEPCKNDEGKGVYTNWTINHINTFESIGIDVHKLSGIFPSFFHRRTRFGVFFVCEFVYLYRFQLVPRHILRFLFSFDFVFSCFALWFLCTTHHTFHFFLYCYFRFWRDSGMWKHIERMLNFFCSEAMHSAYACRKV